MGRQRKMYYLHTPIVQDYNGFSGGTDTQYCPTFDIAHHKLIRDSEARDFLFKPGSIAMAMEHSSIVG